MSAADERARAVKAAAKGLPNTLMGADFHKALLQAEKVSDAWFRCQSLAAVARFAPEGDVVRIANKALDAAMLGKNSYKRVAVAAWPIRALAERGKVQHAQRIIAQLLEEARLIEHPVSKMGALVLLWQAVWPLPAAIKQPVLDTLLVACQAANSWKAGRIMRDVSLIVASEDKAQAQQIIHAMRESVYKRQAQTRFDARQMETLPSFFPPF
jgi:hypothetical protein